MSYYKGEVNPLSEETIGGYLNTIASNFPDRKALVVSHQGITYTWKELNAKVDKIAKGLFAIGINPGDKVAIWSTNNAEWIIAQYATAKIGAILVNINPAYKISELEYAMNQSECVAIILEKEFKASKYFDMLNDALPNLPHLAYKIILGDESYPGYIRWDALVKLGYQTTTDEYLAVQASVKNTDPVNIQYTSGTTGFPKGVTLTHRNILNNAKVSGDILELYETDKVIVPVPLYHCFGIVLSSLLAMTHGSTIIIPSKTFEPVATMQAIQDEKATVLHGVPTMFIAQLEHPDFAKYDLTSLRTGIMAGAPCPVELMKRVINEMHIIGIAIGYGLTEVSPLMTLTPRGDTIEHQTQTVGRTMPGSEIAIMDAEGYEVGFGEIGEICTKGYNVMVGYYNNPKATEKTFWADGWLRSGDLGTLDEDGYVKVTGRIKDMVIRGGENLYPAEIEAFIGTHPAIADVQVVGVPDFKYGEELCAWIKVRAGFKSVTAKEIKSFCKGKIAHYKIPRYIKFVTEYPMTCTGKIRKIDMRAISIKELGLEEVAKIKTA